MYGDPRLEAVYKGLLILAFWVVLLRGSLYHLHFSNTHTLLNTASVPPGLSPPTKNPIRPDV